MLSTVQFLIFELGDRCQLAARHAKCPAHLGPDRWIGLDTRRALDDAMIQLCAFDAYHRFGFTGMIGWHAYNEPTLEAGRMFGLMERIKGVVPQARFVLWTNGLVSVDHSRFDQVHVSDYRGDPDGLGLDDRLDPPAMTSERPCLRPFTEFILDAYGNHHPCCYDWQGKASLGNVFVQGFEHLVRKWQDFRNAVCGRHMTDYAPAACLDCGKRTSAITAFDEGARQRAEQWRRGL